MLPRKSTVTKDTGENSAQIPKPVGITTEQSPADMGYPMTIQALSSILPTSTLGQINSLGNTHLNTAARVLPKRSAVTKDKGKNFSQPTTSTEIPTQPR